MNEQEIATAVAAGAAWLDTELGPDWINDIDLDRLNMASAEACILGQLWNGYWNAPPMVAMEERVREAHMAPLDHPGRFKAVWAARKEAELWSREHGFFCGQPWDSVGCCCGQLHDAWVQLVRGRDVPALQSV